MPPWRNMLLIGADILSLGLHFVILYVPFLAQLFQLEPLNLVEWQWVVILSVPVIFLDEILKFVARQTQRKSNQGGSGADVFLRGFALAILCVCVCVCGLPCLPLQLAIVKLSS